MSDPSREVMLRLELVVKITGDQWVSAAQLADVSIDDIGRQVIDGLRLEADGGYIAGTNDVWYANDIVSVDVLP